MFEFLLTHKGAVALINLAAALVILGFLCVSLYKINMMPTDFSKYFNKYDAWSISSDDTASGAQKLTWGYLRENIKTYNVVFIIMMLNTWALSIMIAGNTLVPGWTSNAFRYPMVCIDLFIGFLMLATAIILPFAYKGGTSIQVIGGVTWIWTIPIGLLFLANAAIFFKALPTPS